MSTRFERYTIEPRTYGARITFDQRRNAMANIACGVILAVFGYLWDAGMGTVLLWIGILWALLAMRAYGDERTTELGEVLTYQHGKTERTLPRQEVTEVALRLRRRTGRRRKESVLPWEVEIRGSGKKPFATYRFQEEEAARGFAARLSEELGTAVADRSDFDEARSSEPQSQLPPR